MHAWLDTSILFAKVHLCLLVFNLNIVDALPPPYDDIKYTLICKADDVLEMMILPLLMIFLLVITLIKIKDTTLFPPSKLL